MLHVYSIFHLTMERPKANQHISDRISEDQHHVVRHNIEDELKHDAPTLKNESEVHKISSAEVIYEDDRHTTSEKKPTIKPKLALQSQAKSSTSSSSSRILESSNTLQQEEPYFYYQNSTHTFQQQYFFALHSNPPSQTSLYSTNNYGTTLTIIILLHIIYFIQWNKHHTKKQVSTNYTQIINKKQYYKVVLALGSHPPVDGGERDTNNNSNSHHTMTNGGGGGGTSLDVPIERNNGLVRRTFCPNCTTIHNTFSSLRRIVRPMLYNILYERLLYPIVYGSLSGLPLLTFASHVLWSCRALEELYDEHDGKLVLGIATDGNGNDGNSTVVNSLLPQFTGIGTDQVQIPSGAATGHYFLDDASSHNSMISSSSTTTSYLRVLVALALTSLLIELILLRSILKRIEYDIPRHDMLRHRPICTITSLTIAILGVYDAHFPYVPPPILPFVRISILSSSGFSLIFSIMILTILSHRIHSLTSIVSGLLSGSLWSLGVTSFLATKYWGNIMLGGLVLCISLSLKAQSYYYGRFMNMCCPCIDYVAWDDEGDIPDGLLSHRRHNTNNNARDGSQSNNSDDGDLEMGDTNNERFPLLSSQSSSMSSGGGGSTSAIRGRVPLTSLQSDIDEDEEDNFVGSSRNNINEESTPVPTVASSSRFGSNLSRRGGGGSGVP